MNQKNISAKIIILFLVSFFLVPKTVSANAAFFISSDVIFLLPTLFIILVVEFFISGS